MMKICVLTATRAEYGLLKPVIRRCCLDKDIDLRVAVTGMHLSEEFGSTYKEIEEDGIPIDVKIPILDDRDTPEAISKAMGKALDGFGKYFTQREPDLLIVLGDRYETLAVSCAAMNQRIPIAHIGGGETTEGAVDEGIRHAITKLSFLHFASTETYRKRIIQMGENPQNVYCTGALGVENIKNETLLDKAHLQESLGIRLDKPYILVTFHPVTLEVGTAEQQINAILDNCRSMKEYLFIFTRANADTSGHVINSLVDKYVLENDNGKVFKSLGLTRYLSAMRYCECVLGNSSSGILETPSFGKPTVNIGDRQKGRIQAESIINCNPRYSDIKQALNLALSTQFKELSRKVQNPYDRGTSSEVIVERIKYYLEHNLINLKKEFFNIDIQF